MVEQHRHWSDWPLGITAGAVFAAFWIAGMLFVMGCNGSSPTAPTPPPVSTPAPAPVPPPAPPPPAVTNYAGRWTGSYIVEQCAGSSGSMDDILCSAPRPGNSGGIFQRGVSLPMLIDLSQNGSAVNGTLSLGTIRGPVNGSVVSNGLILTGSTSFSDASAGLTVTNTITEWNTVLVAGGTLEGTFTFSVRVNTLPGDGTVRVRLSNVRR
jgi:hypothetical protein